jgi:hypothetical protein
MEQYLPRTYGAEYRPRQSVSQSVPLTECNCRLIANLYDDADFNPQVIYDVRIQPRKVT